MLEDCVRGVVYIPVARDWIDPQRFDVWSEPVQYKLMRTQGGDPELVFRTCGDYPRVVVLGIDCEKEEIAREVSDVLERALKTARRL